MKKIQIEITEEQAEKLFNIVSDKEGLIIDSLNDSDSNSAWPSETKRTIRLLQEIVEIKSIIHRALFLDATATPPPS